jgi:hypothetical protein
MAMRVVVPSMGMAVAVVGMAKRHHSNEVDD